MNRISQLVTANINHLLDKAEDPEVMVKQIIRDMEESIIELRRETVRAIARQKHLEKQIQTAADQVKDYEGKAKLALSKKDEAHAKKVIARKLDAAKKRQALEADVKSASGTVESLKSDLAKLEDQVQEARRKKEELIRRKRAAESKLRVQKSKSSAAQAVSSAAKSILNFNETRKSLEDYEEAIIQLESETEAADELLNSAERPAELQKIADDQAVADELERLKKAQKE